MKYINTKIWIGNNPETARQIQQHLFNNGYVWASGDKTLNGQSWALYISDTEITHNTYSDVDYFKNHKYKEIFLTDILNLYYEIY